MSHSARPTVSIVMPSYNRDNIVGRTIDSMLNQTFTDFELIIIDDASTDNALSIFREYEAKDSRVKVIALDKNVGCNPARNIGLKQAKGEWMALNDSDDVWMADKLEKQLNRIAQLSEEEQEKVGAIYCAVDVVELDGSTMKFPAEHEGWVKSELCHRFFGRTCSLVFHERVFEKLGYFDETLDGGDEYDMLLRTADFFSIWCVKEVLSIGYAQKVRRDRFYVSLFDIYEKHYEKLSDYVEQDRMAMELEYCANNMRINREYANSAKCYMWSLKLNAKRPKAWARFLTLPIYPVYRKIKETLRP